MSVSDKPSAGNPEPPHPVSGLLNAAILGAALGAAAMFLVMYYCGYRVNDARHPRAPAQPEVVHVPGAIAVPAADAPLNAKRRLASLVGRMELLSRENLNLRLVLDSDQVEQISALLARLVNADHMTHEQAEGECETLRSLLTPEQNEILDMIGMPRGAGAMASQEFGEFDENPFLQELHRKRLLDLLERVRD